MESNVQVLAGADEPGQDLLGPRELRPSREAVPPISRALRRRRRLASQRGPHALHAGPATSLQHRT